MSSEDVSVIALEPFISKFVFAIIQNIRSQNFSYEEKQVIHADLVPRVSEKVMQSSLKKKEVPPKKGDVEELAVPVSKLVTKAPVEIPLAKISVKKQMPVLSPSKFHKQKPVFSQQAVSPSREQVHLPTMSVPQHKQVSQLQMSHRQKPVSLLPGGRPISPQIVTPSVPGRAEFSQDYGKISLLLNDPAVSLIECQGAGKPLMIVRASQRQITRVVLNSAEIKEILQKVSDGAHIPLLEGVFRAVVDNFSINAIISEMVGSKFVIRKQTPYSLLERQV